jgi:Aminoglycoside-2''-adenylyltransferase
MAISKPQPSAVTPDLMLAEAYRIIDAARAQDVDLRLTGGLAVRHLCSDKDFLRRSHSDIDMVARQAQTAELGELFRSCGYAENLYILTATGGQQRQFYAVPAAPMPPPKNATRRRHAPEPEAEAETAAPHVDVYLDVMRVDHDVWIGDRIDIDDYAISAADLLISKLQAGRFEEKDLRDVVALVKDLPLGDVDAGHQINVGHIADVCSRDWGLYFDVTTNIDGVEDDLPGFGLNDEIEQRVIAALDIIEDAIAEEEKTFGWRLRARLGKRLAWRRDMAETDGSSLVSVAEATRRAQEEASSDAEWTGWPGWGGGRSSNE